MLTDVGVLVGSSFCPSDDEGMVLALDNSVPFNLNALLSGFGFLLFIVSDYQKAAE